MINSGWRHAYPDPVHGFRLRASLVGVQLTSTPEHASDQAVAIIVWPVVQAACGSEGWVLVVSVRFWSL
jgi:hypothetical protein